MKKVSDIFMIILLLAFFGSGMYFVLFEDDFKFGLIMFLFGEVTLLGMRIEALGKRLEEKSDAKQIG